MLRKMCKVCRNQYKTKGDASNRFSYYYNRIQTGEIVKKERKYDVTITTLRCSNCGHEWTYRRTKHRKA